MKKLTLEQKSEIVEKYKSGKYSCNKLGIEYCVGYQSIIYILKKMSIQICNDKSKLNKKYSIDENYFDVIDSEGKAYFLGLMYADGYNDEKRGCVSIQLQDRDKDILDIFNTELKTNRPLSFSNGRKINHRNYYRLNIVSKHISKKLAELGCFQKKSLTLNFPTNKQVPDYLINHFIRGYFDGDGCVTSSNNILRADFSCNDLFCDELINVFKKHDISSSIHKPKKAIENDNSNTRLFISGNKNLMKCFDFMYKNSSIFLNRKYMKFKEHYEY